MRRLGLMAPWLALPLMLLVTLPLNILMSRDDMRSATADGIDAVTVVQLVVIGIGLSVGVVAVVSDKALGMRWRLLALASYLPVVVFAALLVGR